MFLNTFSIFSPSLFNDNKISVLYHKYSMVFIAQVEWKSCQPTAYRLVRLVETQSRQEDVTSRESVG